MAIASSILPAFIKALDSALAFSATDLSAATSSAVLALAPMSQAKPVGPDPFWPLYAFTSSMGASMSVLAVSATDTGLGSAAGASLEASATGAGSGRLGGGLHRG